MININFKAITSALGALALTAFLSWTFVDSTTLARVQHVASPGFVAAVSALVR